MWCLSTGLQTNTTCDSLSLKQTPDCPQKEQPAYLAPCSFLYRLPRPALPALTLHTNLLACESVAWSCRANYLDGWGTTCIVLCLAFSLIMNSMLMASSSFRRSALVWESLMTPTRRWMCIKIWSTHPPGNPTYVYLSPANKLWFWFTLVVVQINIAFLNMILCSIGFSPASIQARTLEKAPGICKIKRPIMFWTCSSFFRVFFVITYF